MPLIKLYIVPALLLLALTCDGLPVTPAGPVIGDEQMMNSCVTYARMLLENITNTLSENKLFSGINCTKQNMDLRTETNTPFVCAPQESTCPGITQPRSQFNEEACLTSIKKDLNHFYKFVAAHPDRPTMYHLRQLMENCFKLPLQMDLEEVATGHASTYDERLTLCKVLKGFQVRTITINRAIGYMASRERSAE